MVIGGGVSMGQCPNACFPELVVCLEHAEKSTLAYMVTKKTKMLTDVRRLLEHCARHSACDDVVGDVLALLKE